jgi:hypothetical protein
MITTITTTTTTTTVVMLQQAAFIVAFGVMILIASLLTRELLGATQRKAKVASLAGNLKIAILPLLFAFAIVIAIKIWEVIYIGPQ